MQVFIRQKIIVSVTPYIPTRYSFDQTIVVLLPAHMGTTRSHLYSHRHNKLAGLLKSLAHPARIAIVEIVLAHESRTLKDLAEALPLSNITLHQHLEELINVGLVKIKRKGWFVSYSINHTAWKKHRAVLDVFFDSIVAGKTE